MNLEPDPKRRRGWRWRGAVVAFVVSSSIHYDSRATWARWVFGDERWEAGDFQVWQPGLLVVLATVTAFVLANRRRRPPPEA